MRAVINFFKGKTGGVVLLAIALGVGFYFLKNSRERSAIAAEKAAKEDGTVNRERVGVLSPEKEGVKPGEETRLETVDNGKIHRFSPRKAEREKQSPERLVVAPPPGEKGSGKFVLPALIQKTDGSAAKPRLSLKEPTLFAPRGLLIKATLVLTVESGSLTTPVLGIVTEDVYWNQKLIVPAGTWVHALARQGRQRDRIEIAGSWTFVWQDGREYAIQGLGLNHEFDQKAGFSITDGSAGIRGRVLKSDKHQELKIMAATALAGAAKASEETAQTIFGQVPDNSISNAGLEGVSKAADQYAKLLLERLKEEGYYVRVPAGTQFYIYTQQVFEPRLASIGGLKQGGKAVSGFDLVRASHKERERAFERTVQAQAGRGDSTVQERERVDKILEEKERYMKQVREYLRRNDPATQEAERVLEKEKHGVKTNQP